MWKVDQEKRRRKYEEGRRTISVTIDGQTFEIKQGTFPGGLFPIPKWLSRMIGYPD